MHYAAQRRQKASGGRRIEHLESPPLHRRASGDVVVATWSSSQRREDQRRPEWVPDEDPATWELVPGRVSREIDERLLSLVIDDWIDRGCVRLSIFPQNGKRAVRLTGGGLLAALAVQLVFEVCRTDGLAVCTSCGTPYLPATRRPRRDQNPYCSDCGIKAARRDAAARYWRTEKYQEARRRRQARAHPG